MARARQLQELRELRTAPNFLASASAKVDGGFAQAARLSYAELAAHVRWEARAGMLPKVEPISRALCCSARAAGQRGGADNGQDGVRLTWPQYVELNTDTVGLLPTHDTGKTKIAGCPRQAPHDYYARAERQQLRRLDEGPADAEILGHTLERWTAYLLAQDGNFDFRAGMGSSVLPGHFWTKRLELFQLGLWELVEGHQVIYDP